MAKWQKTLRAETLQDVLGAMLEYTAAQSKQLHSEAISSEHMPRLEKLRSRMRWLDDTAGVTLLGKDTQELSALIQRKSARAKVSFGLRLTDKLCQAAEGDLHNLLGCMGAAFEDCRGLAVSTEEAVRGVHRVSNMAETTRKYVELASGMLSLIPDSALAAEADDGTRNAGLTASGSEAGLTAPDTDAGMTARDVGSASTLRKRFAIRSLGGA